MRSDPQLVYRATASASAVSRSSGYAPTWIAWRLDAGKQGGNELIFPVPSFVLIRYYRHYAQGVLALQWLSDCYGAELAIAYVLIVAIQHP